MGKVLLLIIVVAITLYLLLRLLDRRSRQTPPRTLAPDDDLDFLRDLNRRQRHANDEAQTDED